jgi:hypothetical protein
MNYNTDIKINKTDVLENNIQYFLNNPNKPSFIYCNTELEPKEIFLQRFEAMHNAVWSFYNLGKYASYLRFWFDGKEIKREVINTDAKYVLKAKNSLVTIGQNTSIFITPPVQMCKACSMIYECDRFTKKLSDKKGSKKNVRNTTN